MLVTKLVQLFNRVRQVYRSPDGNDLVFNAADFDPPLHTRLLILQPTPFCNLDCDYCYR
jgi:sulfatase maturation enzyme AslB (radical SAM superfamily)